MRVLQKVAVLSAAGCVLASSSCDPWTGGQSAAQTKKSEESRRGRSRDAERAACLAMRGNIEGVAALAGAPELERQRHRVLGRAKGSPVAFRRPPIRDEAVLTAYFADQARALGDPRRVYATLKTLRNIAKFSREQVREILLPEGYFYADEPALAQWLVTRFKLETFFAEREIWLLRGTQVHRVVRSDEGYRHADGERAGKKASLLLFDRVALTRQELFPPLHVDFESAAAAWGFDRVRIDRITPIGLSAHIRYGAKDLWLPAAFTTEDGRANLACELIKPSVNARVVAFRKEQRERERASVKLRAAVRMQADERLPFDEPREEEGQQDGSLRPAWEWAYRREWVGYSFNKVWYPVFDQQGRPHPPQVCIDFILDSFERAAGTWFRGQHEPRERAIGTLDFGTFDIRNRRSVEVVVDHFRENPGTFDVWDLAPEERIRYIARDDFLDFVVERADRFRLNDVVVIHGPRGAEAHYHSFIVMQSDPITGMPIVLAENAGKPRMRSWQSVMQSAPLRSIRNVLRPREAWLAEALRESNVNLARASTEGAGAPARGGRAEP